MNALESVLTSSSSPSYVVDKKSNADFSVEEKINQKNEKHKIEALSILIEEITPYQAFKNGFEKAIASYIKLDQEGNKTQLLVSGPQKKERETQIMEELIHLLLTDYCSVLFFKEGENYFFSMNKEKHNFSDLINKANFNHLTISNKDLLNYEKLLESSWIQNKPYFFEFSKNPDSEDNYPQLSSAEKKAINIYTGDYYYVMNNLLRGNIEEAVSGDRRENHFDLNNQKETDFNLTIKEALLHSSVAVFALNKLPDFCPKLDENGNLPKYLYRGEPFLLDSIIDGRKKAVLEGGQVTKEMGFLSTAFKYPHKTFFDKFSRSAVLVKNLKGKKISFLSQSPNEREILIPPTQIQWSYYKDFKSDLKNVITLFIAKPVTVPDEKPTIENEKSKQVKLKKKTKLVT